jgi:hypothetical protein
MTRRIEGAARAPRPDRMVATALRSRQELVREGRGICVLRRQFPDHAQNLARRMALPVRQAAARMQILYRDGADLARDTMFQDVALPKGTPVDDLGHTRGTVFASFEGLMGRTNMAIDVALSGMRAMTQADRKRLVERPVVNGHHVPDPDDSPAP